MSLSGAVGIAPLTKKELEDLQNIKGTHEEWTKELEKKSGALDKGELLSSPQPPLQITLEEFYKKHGGK